MVNNENLISLINNKKPVELVQELKDYEIKNSPLSKVARNSNKIIKKSGGYYISENEGYGPCSSRSCGYSSSFKLDIILRNSRGGSKAKTVNNVDDARREATDVVMGIGYWANDGRRKFSYAERTSLASRINDLIVFHTNGGAVVNNSVVN